MYNCLCNIYALKHFKKFLQLYSYIFFTSRIITKKNGGGGNFRVTTLYIQKQDRAHFLRKHLIALLKFLNNEHIGIIILSEIFIHGRHKVLIIKKKRRTSPYLKSEPKSSFFIFQN